MSKPVSNSIQPPKVSEVMRQISDEIRSRTPPPPPNGSTPFAPTVGSPPAPPELSISPLKEDQPETYAEINERARQKTEVNRLIPKFLRGLFRRQGGFNQEVLALGKLLTKETREAKKRVREIAAYLQAENGWLHGVMNAIAQANASLQARLENQQSFERRLLDLNDRMAQVKADSLQREHELSASLQSISADLANERIARSQLQADMEAFAEQDRRELESRAAFERRVAETESELRTLLQSSELMKVTLTADAAARSRLEQQVEAMHRRLDGVSDVLAAVREALMGEAKAREQFEERVNGQHRRLDAFSDTLQVLQNALAARHDRDVSAVSAARTESEVARDKIHAAEASLASMRKSLTTIEARQFEDASFLKRELHLYSQRLLALQETARRARGPKGSQAPSSTPAQEDQHRFDGFYLAFENQFRGSRADIKDRVRVYLPLLKKAGLHKKSKAPILDLGCGRGEWLELLRDEGFVGRGVDLNLFMVEEGKERKLDCTQADVIEHLATLPSNSQGAVTAFHLIEHLPFPTLMQLFAEALRILRPGGICVFETPNPDNVQVGSNRFYSDPTHRHPLPHYLTEFLLHSVGFKSLEVLRLHPDGDAVALADEADAFERFTHQMFFGAQDYAVIGRK